MDTLKTGVIVVLLLAVLYGVYVVLNTEEPVPPTAEIAWHQQQADQELQIEISSPDVTPVSVTATPGALESGSLGDSALAPADLSASATAASNAPAPSATLAAPPLSVPSAAGPAGDSLSAGVQNPAVDVNSVAVPGAAAVPVASEVSAITAAPGPSGTDALPAAGSASAGTSVTAPTLLATPADGVSQPQVVPASDVPSPQDGLSSLPNLRETTGVSPELPSADSVPAPPDASPAATGLPAPSLPNGNAASVASPQPDAVQVPAEPGVPAVAEPNPGAKLVSTAVAFESAMREVQSNLAAEQWYQALFVLSKFYGSPDLSAQQHQELVDLLDPLAARVVYSPQHLVTDAYEVRRGDTLSQVCAVYQVPPELLANINGIDNPNLLLPGTKLKVVRGPFRADISLQQKELTLFVGQLYAGRFPVSIGQDPVPQPGEYRVVEKQPGRDYFPANGPLLSAGDPQNPYGRVWIGLDKRLAIHGSPERGDSGTMGCISLSPLDAGDVFNILSVGSSVVVRP